MGGRRKQRQDDGCTEDQRRWVNELIAQTEQGQREGRLAMGVRSDARLSGAAVDAEELRKLLLLYPRASIGYFIAQYGEVFGLPETPPNILLREPRQCFFNAAHLSTIFFGGYGYAEGFVLPPWLIPVHHAWNFDLKTGEVVDSTLGWAPKAAYLGVRIPEDKLRAQLGATRTYGALTAAKGWEPSELVQNWTN